MDLQELSLAVQKGKRKIVKQLVQQGIDEGMDAKDILDNGLISAMGIIGEEFKENKIFIKI